MNVADPIDLTSLTIHAAASLMQSGELSARALTRLYLERITSLDQRLNAFITLTDDLALEQAEQADRERQQGRLRGPLHGIPLALKDLFKTAGVKTTAGSSFWRENIPARSAFVVERLHQAGAVILGKLNMHEIALGVTNANPHFGPCHNPWDLARSPGGSSGGSAAAVASGMCLGSLGTDSGGSIRIPAALCGVVGLKPTYGRVSLSGVIPLSWSTDHVGPLARCVADAALLYQSIAGYDPLDPVCQPQPLEDALASLDGSIQGWRIALLADSYLDKAHPEVLNAIQDAARLLSELGAQVTPVKLPDLRLAAQTNGLVVVAEAAAFHHLRLQEHPTGFGEDVRQRLETGAGTSIQDYILARRTQQELRRSLETFFMDYDLLCLPATPVTAPLISGPDAVEQARLLTRFTAPFNITGLPAIVLPCGFSSTGLPIGMQLVARPWAENALLRAAQAYENATSWHARKPVL